MRLPGRPEEVRAKKLIIRYKFVLKQIEECNAGNCNFSTKNAVIMVDHSLERYFHMLYTVKPLIAATLAAKDKWPLFRGGRYSEAVSYTHLTLPTIA